MVTIYALYDDNTILYVGLTSKTIEERLYSHIHQKNKNCALDLVKNIGDVRIIKLEECDEDIMRETEGFYIDFLQPLLNKRGAGLTDTESKRRWREKNKEYHYEYLKAWRQKKLSNSV